MAVDRPASKPTALEKRAIIQAELDYRRGRRASVVTWADTLLVAITGGVVGLQIQTGRELSSDRRLQVALAVIVLVSLAAAWWWSHRRIEAFLLDRRKELDETIGVDLGSDHRTELTHVRGIASVVILGVAALLVVWLPTWTS